jgi:hypothetical protein
MATVVAATAEALVSCVIPLAAVYITMRILFVLDQAFFAIRTVASVATEVQLQLGSASVADVVLDDPNVHFKLGTMVTKSLMGADMAFDISRLDQGEVLLRIRVPSLAKIGSKIP